MTDKRVFPRRKRRLTVNYEIEGIKYTGFTYDLSHTGIFVAGVRMPKIGQVLQIVLELPRAGKTDKIPIVGRVIRALRVPPSLAASVPHGFALQIGGLNEPYAMFVESLH